MNRRKMECIHSLWDELTDFEASQSDAALNHLMAALCRMVNAQNANWIGAVRLDKECACDPLKGWRCPAIRQLYPMAPQPDQEIYKSIQRQWERREVDPSFLIPIRGAGKFRHHSYRQTLPPEWFESPFYKQFYATVGIYDSTYIGFPLNQNAESHFGFHRMNTRKAFGAEEMRLLAYALRGIKWFHKQIMLGHGLLVATSPVSPSERKVLHLLLTEASEKEIASQLGLSPSTTHQYITGIFRKFGVSGRAGLVSLWLRRCD